jgi:acyl-homoserine lactone acylase PvdQ
LRALKDQLVAASDHEPGVQVLGKPPRRSLRFEGLKAPPQILVDGWRVPYVYAFSVDDTFFAQGFDAARDLLWQIDLWRRGLELLAPFSGHASTVKSIAP